MIAVNTNKKLVIILSILLIIILIICAFLYRNYRKQKWLNYKNTIENKKAPEITIKLIEGWSNKEIAEYLEKQKIISASAFLKNTTNFSNSEYLNLLPKEAKNNLQGFLYPDTYRLFESISNRTITTEQDAVHIITKKLLDNFLKKLPENAETLAKKQGLNLYETIILASIIEKETGRNAVTEQSKTNLANERKIVAGIFYNRLKANIPLQSDATINYITGKNDPSALLVDLEINSPYNTYKNRGLPPSPITNPSISSILAVLEPTNTEYLYFLHKQPSGEAVYAKTFEEHIQNKFKYLK